MRRILVPILTLAPLVLVGAGLWCLFRWEVAAVAVGGLWWFDDEGATK